MKAMLTTPLSTLLHVPSAGQCIGIRFCGKLSPSLPLSRGPITRCVCTLVAHNLPQVTEGPTSHLVEQEFAELNITHVSGQVGGIRTRQHVNPLKAHLMVPVSPPKWEDIFPDPSMPIMVDIGCGSGRFLMMLAKRNAKSCNYLGLEIRHQLVSRAKLWTNELKLKNLHFMVANATVSFGLLLSTYPGPLRYVTILCPDPHFKVRHHKRRIVQRQLVDTIVNALVPGGQVFLQSDVKEVAEDMKRQFDTKVGVSLIDELKANPSIHDDEGWLLENPLGIRTEREIHAIMTGGKMYRNLYTRL